MHLFYCDESNLDKRPGDFFVYGGLIIPGETADRLSQRVEFLRKDVRVDPDVTLKFNPKPPNITHAEFTALKQSVLEAAVEAGCTLIVSVILHDLASSPDDARRNEINRVCMNFDYVLGLRKDVGLVLIDRFEDRQIDHHLRDKFSVGLTGLQFPQPKRMERILGFHYSAIGCRRSQSLNHSGSHSVNLPV